MSSPAAEASKAPVPSTWAAMRIGLFRALWIGSLVSNIGTWMQTVGAQWLLVQEPNAATWVSLVQTAQALPVLLFALPAGVLADSFDRRLLLLGVQGFQAVVALVLTLVTASGAMTPPLLLALTFALGAGSAVQAPAYQAVIPELVPRHLVPGASVLGSINVNLARAVGPALAGLIVARLGVTAVFAANVATFVVVAAILLAWRHDTEPSGSERFMPGLRAGGRYVRHSPVVRRIMLRCAMFVVPANVLWALLALVAERRFDLGAGGYGVMLAALGIGSIAGAFIIPRAWALLSANGLVAVGSLLYALTLVILVVAPTAWLGIIGLLPAGVAWMGVLSTLNATLQTFLPVWVRARGLAIYQLVMFGSMAAAGPVWGTIAEHFGLGAAYLSAAALLVLGAAATRLLPMKDVAHMDRDPALFWPEPRLALESEEHPGEVLIILTYAVGEEHRREFLDLMPTVRRMRRRTGATAWRLYVDAAEPERYLELYTVASWNEHILQHSGRLTGSDREIDLHARRLSKEPVEVQHLFTAQLRDD